jgi:hypothetical protein
MTDLEFDILDELYFVTPFEQLRQTLGMDELPLKQALEALISKGWVKCFHVGSIEIVTTEMNLNDEYRHYHYLATKAGLFAHNSR